MTDFARCFDDFQYTAFRLETFQRYDVPEEAEMLAAWRGHRPMPERSPRTDPFLANIAQTTAAGKQWSRVHVVDLPLSEYIRYELAAYGDSARGGEVISIAERRASPALDALRSDFWLFDVGTPRAVAVLMEYDSAGRWLGASASTDPGVIESCTAARAIALQHAVPLERYLDKEAIAV